MPPRRICGVSMWEEHDAALLDTLGTLLQKSREKEVSLVAG